MLLEPRPDVRRDELRDPARQRGYVQGNDTIRERRACLVGDLLEGPEASIRLRDTEQAVHRKNDPWVNPDVGGRHLVLVELPRTVGNALHHFRGTVVVVATDDPARPAHPECVGDVRGDRVIAVVTVDIDHVEESVAQSREPDARIADYLDHVGQPDRLSDVELEDVVIEAVAAAHDLESVRGVLDLATVVPDVQAVDRVVADAEALEGVSPGRRTDPAETSYLEDRDLVATRFDVRFDEGVDHCEGDRTPRNGKRRRVETRSARRYEVEPGAKIHAAPFVARTGRRSCPHPSRRASGRDRRGGDPFRAPRR